MSNEKTESENNMNTQAQSKFSIKLVLSVIFAIIIVVSSVIILNSHKPKFDSKLTNNVTATKVVAQEPASSSTLDLTPKNDFEKSFNNVVIAVKLDTKNNAIPATPDDTYFSNELGSLSKEELLNLFKVIYIRASNNTSNLLNKVDLNLSSAQPSQNQAVNNDQFNAESGGDQVLNLLIGNK